MAILLTSLVAAGFAGGAFFEHQKFFPHAKVMSVLRRLKGGSPPARVDGPEKNEWLSRTEGGEPAFHKEIDSTLLPLQVTGLKVGARFPVAKFAGGIAAIRNGVIIVDRLGAVFAFQNGQLSQPTFPKLPAHLEEFLLHATLNNENFRVHDVEYLAAEKALAVSHEVYDTEAKQARLTVSLIDFDKESMQPRGDWRTLWRGDVAPLGQPPTTPGGGRLVAGASHRLYLTTIDYIPDDYSHPSPDMAQDPKSSFGKVVQIDLNTGSSENVSWGHRNPQGLVWTRAGELLSVEHGPAGGDELNVITPGANYGYPSVTLGTEYDSYNWPSTAPVGRHDGFTPPLYAWVPSVATNNLIELHGFHPRWEGDLLVGSLKACSLFRVRREGARVLYSEPIWIGERIRDLTQLEDGTIVLWTDSANLLLVKADEAKLQNKKAHEGTPPALATCMKCHHFGPTNPSHPAPTLSNVLGRQVASDTFVPYSPALKSVGGVWDATRLRAFLTDPPRFAEGTTMPKSDLTEPELEAISLELQKQTAR